MNYRDIQPRGIRVIPVFIAFILWLPGRSIGQDLPPALVMTGQVRTLAMPLVVREWPVAPTDEEAARVRVEASPVTSVVRVKCLEFPGETARTLLTDSGGTLWHSGRIRIDRGSDAFPTDQLPPGRYLLSVKDEEDHLRNRFILIKN